MSKFEIGFAYLSNRLQISRNCDKKKRQPMFVYQNSSCHVFGSQILILDYNLYVVSLYRSGYILTSDSYFFFTLFTKTETEFRLD